MNQVNHRTFRNTKRSFGVDGVVAVRGATVPAGAGSVASDIGRITAAGDEIFASACLSGRCELPVQFVAPWIRIDDEFDGHFACFTLRLCAGKRKHKKGSEQHEKCRNKVTHRDGVKVWISNIRELDSLASNASFAVAYAHPPISFQNALL